MQNIEVYRRDADPALPHVIYNDVIKIRRLRDFVDEYTLADGRVFELDAREYHIILYTPRESPQARYDAKNTTQVALKLNLKTDADILAKLALVANKQGYIKALIRADLAAHASER